MSTRPEVMLPPPLPSESTATLEELTRTVAHLAVQIAAINRTVMTMANALTDLKGHVDGKLAAVTVEVQVISGTASVAIGELTEVLKQQALMFETWRRETRHLRSEHPTDPNLVRRPSSSYSSSPPPPEET